MGLRNDEVADKFKDRNRSGGGVVQEVGSCKVVCCQSACGVAHLIK